MKKFLCMTMLMLAALTVSAMAQTKAASPPEQDIAAAVKGASLSWTTEAETDENTVSDDDNTQTGGGSQTPSGELEG